MKKIDKQKEDDGQDWFAQMHALILAGNYDAYNKAMNEVKEDYRIEYEILGCIGALTDSENPTENNPVNPLVVSNIQVTNQKPLGYKITTMIGNIGFFRLSEALRFTNDGIQNNQRQGECHDKSFEIALRVENKARLVTGLVSILSEKHTFLHSWVEDDDVECAYDYTINAGISIHNYRELMHAQKPLIEINNEDIKSGKIAYDDWGKIVYALYGDE